MRLLRTIGIGMTAWGAYKAYKSYRNSHARTTNTVRMDRGTL